MEHEKEALREADRHRAEMVEKYAKLEDEAERHKRDAQRSSELVKATRENLMFLTKALKMAKAEADGLRKEKVQAESRADMAETAVREAREEISRAMARSPSPGSDLDSQSVASRISFEPSLAQGSWDPAKTQGRDFAKGVLVLSCGVRTRDGQSLLVRFAARDGRLEARALDCSGGSAGFVVLCRIPDNASTQEQRSLCEKLASSTTGSRWQSSAGRPATTRRRPGRLEAPSAHPRQK